VKRRKQNHKISFQFFAAPPPCTPPAVFLRIRKFLVLRARLEGARPRRGGVSITTRSARKIMLRATTHAARGLFVKILRILFIQCSNFVQKAPQIFHYLGTMLRWWCDDQNYRIERYARKVARVTPQIFHCLGMMLRWWCDDQNYRT
jgi:hypothetical protein